MKMYSKSKVLFIRLVRYLFGCPNRLFCFWTGFTTFFWGTSFFWFVQAVRVMYAFQNLVSKPVNGNAYFIIVVTLLGLSGFFFLIGYIHAVASPCSEEVACKKEVY